MEASGVQLLFFQHIKSQLAPHLSLVDEISDILGISTDSAYRRIRAEKPISFEELQKLCRHYKISLDHFLHLKSDSFLFTGQLANGSDFSMENYLKDMVNQFAFFNSFSNKHLYWLVKDIPPWLHFQSPELAAFRIFFWEKSILHYDAMRGKKFSLSQVKPEQIQICDKVLHEYNKVPTTDIWNIENINSTLRLIQFYRESNVFSSPDDYKILYSKLEDIINHLEKQAETGLKFRMGQEPNNNSASFSMFINELSYGDNTGFLVLDNVKVTFINHSVINYMSTRDTRFNDYLFGMLQNLIRKSTQISTVGEKERARFFNRMRAVLAEATAQ